MGWQSGWRVGSSKCYHRGEAPSKASPQQHGSVFLQASSLANQQHSMYRLLPCTGLQAYGAVTTAGLSSSNTALFLHGGLNVDRATLTRHHSLLHVCRWCCLQPELQRVLYPVFVHVYLQLVSYGAPQKAAELLHRYRCVASTCLLPARRRLTEPRPLTSTALSCSSKTVAGVSRGHMRAITQSDTCHRVC